jgi:hypothetical protein
MTHRVFKKSIRIDNSVLALLHFVSFEEHGVLRS